MDDVNRFAVYFSHSWRPGDVDLNLQIWHELAGDCELIVDVPEEPGADPPYFINRIEELLRRTDVFVSVLTHRKAREGEFSGVDARLQCSPYSLFEIRLAERTDITRLILYERSTGFQPPRTIRPWEAYVEFYRVRNEPHVEQRLWGTVIQPKMQQWKKWAADHSRPMSYEQSKMAVLLFSSSIPQSVGDVVEECLRTGGYWSRRVDPNRQRSSEALRMIREAGLIVADVGTSDPLQEQLYAAAHGLGIPAIRMKPEPSGEMDLPWILRGDPGGYQHDIVRWNTAEELAVLLEPRIEAMFRLSAARRDGEASDYLQSKRYSQFFVFISHTLKPPHRTIIEQVYELLKQRHVTPFEYHQVNTAGIDWREALKTSLQKTTHFVALLSPEYEQSQTCTYELEEILARGPEVSILPFMLAGRNAPSPKLAHMHNRLLSDPDPRVDARVVVDQLMGALNAAVGRLASSPKS